jgi:hypothetical protein
MLLLLLQMDVWLQPVSCAATTGGLKPCCCSVVSLVSLQALVAAVQCH